MDYSKFIDESFDPKDWINAAFKLNKNSGVSNDQYATTLVMKLQMLIQEVNNVIEETSQEVVSNLPRVLRDIEVVKQEALLLQDQMKLVKQDIQKVEHDTSQSMQILLQLDTIKSRMEEASDALREADNWTVLSTEVEGVIQSGDVDTLAAKLVAMQQSLKLLSNVPDYDDRCQHLDALKNRLESLVSPHMVTALTNGSTDEMRKFVKMFGDIQRLPQISKYYEHYHKSLITKVWTDLIENANNIPSALSQFYDSLMSTWHNQVLWCSKVFDNPIEVVCNMIAASLSSLDSNITSAIAQYLETQDNVLFSVSTLRKTTARFANAIEKEILERNGAPLHTSFLAQFVSVIYQPYRPYLDQYSKLEDHFMMQELETIKMDHRDIDETTIYLSQSVPNVFKVCKVVNDRCLDFTDGYGYISVLESFRRYISSYVKEFRRVLVNIGEKFKKLHHTEESDSWSIFQHSLRIIQICGDGILEMEEFDQNVVVNILLTGDKLKKETPTPLSDFEAIFLKSPSDKTRLEGLLGAVIEKQAAMTSSVKEMRLLSEEAHKLAFDVVFTVIATHLHQLSESSVWQSKSAGGALTADLPTFSLSPQEYITQIGQYLMMLPQHLEPFTIGDNVAIAIATRHGKLPYMSMDDAVEQIDNRWLESVSKATMHAYSEEILRIPEITEHATRQLITDIDYLTNVLDDLGLSPTEPLISIAGLLKATPSDFNTVRKTTLPRIADCVASMRNLKQT